MALSRSNAEPESAAETTSALTAAKQESAEDTSNGKYLAAAICGSLLVLAATTAKLRKWKQPKGREPSGFNEHMFVSL